MKIKTLRKRDTKEFVHILEGGVVATAGIPDLLPMTATIDVLKKYYDTITPIEHPDFDNLEVVEMELIEGDKLEEIGADIRNKLSPPKNLVALLEEYLGKPAKARHSKSKLLKVIRQSMEMTKTSVEYLTNLL